jgi:hypothetical protein
MTIKLRPTCLGSGIDKDRPDYTMYCGQWNDDDYDVLADGVVVGRIMKAAAKPADASWL